MTGTSFNPLPSPKQGETGPIFGELVYEIVSIRSPHRSKGRRRFALVGTSDTYVSIRSPHRSKGRPNRPTKRHSFRPVSIRSPHRSKGRPPPVDTLYRASKFQSAPLTEARGDCAAHTVQLHQPSFNPLPSPKQGETQSLDFRPALCSCFNPLPSPKQGETCFCLGWLT